MWAFKHSSEKYRYFKVLLLWALTEWFSHRETRCHSPLYYSKADMFGPHHNSLWRTYHKNNLEQAVWNFQKDTSILATWNSTSTSVWPPLHRKPFLAIKQSRKRFCLVLKSIKFTSPAFFTSSLHDAAQPWPRLKMLVQYQPWRPPLHMAMPPP